MIERGIAAVLLATPAVVALAGQQVCPEKIPQTAGLPALTQARVGTDRKKTLQGVSGLTRADVQLTCWALDAGTAKLLAEAARTVLVGTRSQPQRFPTVWGVYRVQAALANDDVDGFSPPIHADDVGLYHTSFVLEAWFEEN